MERLDQFKPQARLIIEAESLPTNITELQHLTHSSCLTSLTCASRFTEHENDTLRVAYSLLLNIICTSSNLRILRLENYSSDAAPERYPRLSPQPGDQFPAIEHLHLSGYFAVEMEKSSHWANAIQWTTLKSLSLGTQAIVPFMRLAKGRLTHIESLGIFWDCHHGWSYLRSIEDFFLDCLIDLPNLRSFAWTNLTLNIVRGICTLLGEQLRSFTYHRVEDDLYGSAYATTSSFHGGTLGSLVPLLPLLEILEVTISWQGKWVSRTPNWPCTLANQVPSSSRGSSLRLPNSQTCDT